MFLHFTDKAASDRVIKQTHMEQCLTVEGLVLVWQSDHVL